MPSVKNGESLFTQMRGISRHLLGWITSPAHDLVYHNPDYDSKKVLPDTEGNPQGTVIYCVHGIYDRPFAYRYFIKYLLTDLPPTVEKIIVIASLPNRKNNLNEEANHLLKKIVSEGSRRVILIGHSRGGLIVSFFAEMFAHSIKPSITIEGIITLGAPFKGSIILKLIPNRFQGFLPKSLYEMTIGSELLKRLTQKMAHSSYSYYLISSTHDRFVSLESSQPVVPTHDKGMIFKNLGHLSLMSSPAVAKYLKEILENICFGVQRIGKP